MKRLRVTASLMVALTTYNAESAQSDIEDNYRGRVADSPPPRRREIVATLIGSYKKRWVKSEKVFPDERPG